MGRRSGGVRDCLLRPPSPRLCTDAMEQYDEIAKGCHLFTKYLPVTSFSSPQPPLNSDKAIELGEQNTPLSNRRRFFFHRNDSEFLLTILIFLKASLYLDSVLKSALSG